MRSTRLRELLDSGTNRSAPTIAEMIEPPLDHVSHTLPERRSDLSFVLNPIETDVTDHVLENDEDDSNMSADGEADNVGYKPFSWLSMGI